MTTTNKVYVVKYTWYHYNTGAGDNGYQHDEETFPNFESARAWSKKVEYAARLKKGGFAAGDYRFSDEVCDDCGYITSFDGILIRTTLETEIELP